MYKKHCNHCGELISEVPLYRCPCCGGTVTNANPKRKTKRAERREKRQKEGQK